MCKINGFKTSVWNCKRDGCLLGWGQKAELKERKGQTGIYGSMNHTVVWRS